MELRTYQLEAIEAILAKLRTSNNALLVLPTGVGKTKCTAGLMQRIISHSPNAKILFLVNRVALVRQAAGVFARDLGRQNVTIFCGSLNSYDFHGSVVVGSVQSLGGIRERHVDVIILDEAHNVVDDGDSHYSKFLDKCRETNPNVRVVGLTATPFRSNGLIYGKGQLFDGICYRKDLNWAIENGFLVKPTMKHVAEQFDVDGLSIVAGDYNSAELEKLATDEKTEAQVKDALPRLIGRKKIVWMCTGIKHAELLYNILWKHGEDAACLHSNMDDGVRLAAVEAFEHGSARHLTFVSIVSEGYDYPPIDAVCLMRPTRSPVRYVQGVGRGLRTAPGKGDSCLVLDYGRVIENCGPLDDPRIRIKGENKKKEDEAKRMRFCPKCYEYHLASLQTCPACGHMHIKEERDGTKSLTAIHLGGAILAKEAEAKWIEISGGKVEFYITKAKRECLRVSYQPRNLFQAPFMDYVLPPTNSFFQGLAAKKLKVLGVSTAVYGEDLKASAQVINMSAKWPKKIQVSYAGQFPEIVSFEH